MEIISFTRYSEPLQSGVPKPHTLKYTGIPDKNLVVVSEKEGHCKIHNGYEHPHDHAVLELQMVKERIGKKHYTFHNDGATFYGIKIVDCDHSKIEELLNSEELRHHPGKLKESLDVLVEERDKELQTTP